MACFRSLSDCAITAPRSSPLQGTCRARPPFCVSEGNHQGAAVRSCVMPIANLSTNEITTLEGLGTLEKLHPLQKAFIDEQAAQCGYCASGMIISAADLLKRNPQATEAEVRSALAGNLCRCGSHNRIIRAVMRVAQANGRI